MSTHITNVVEVLVGATLIGITMTTSATPLGGFAVLPLIGIVPILFGIYGVQTPVLKSVSRAYHYVREQAAHAIEKIKHHTAHTA